FDFDQTRVEPFLRAAVVHFKTGSFEESGGDTALSARSESRNVGTTLAGVRINHTYHASDTATLELRGPPGRRHSFGNVTPESHMRFQGGDSFKIEGVSMARNALSLETGVDARIGQDMRLGLSYVGEFGDGVTSNGVQGNFSWQF